MNIKFRKLSSKEVFKCQAFDLYRALTKKEVSLWTYLLIVLGLKKINAFAIRHYILQAVYTLVLLIYKLNLLLFYLSFVLVRVSNLVASHQL